MSITIDPIQKKALQREFIEALQEAGLVVVPKHVSVFAVEFEKRKREFLKRKAATPYAIAKYKLINGVRTSKTVMNMIADGRIRTGEWYKDNRGVTYVLTIAIKRLNNE